MVGNFDLKESFHYKKKNLHDTAEGPDIRLWAVTLSVEHLWGQVIRSTADCSESKHTTFFYNPSKESSRLPRYATLTAVHLPAPQVSNVY